MLSIAATAKQGMDLLAQHSATSEEVALEHGHVADRSKWRLVGPMHLADTREQAERDVEYGIAEFSRYFTHILPAGHAGETPAEIIASDRESSFAVIGTPEDAVARIEELVEASDGRFGAFLLFDHDWAPPAAKLHSYELFSQYVIPHFTGQLAAPAASSDWVAENGTEFVDRAAHAIGKAIEDHAAERQAKNAPR